MTPGILLKAPPSGGGAEFSVQRFLSAAPRKPSVHFLDSHASHVQYEYYLTYSYLSYLVV